MSYHVIYIYMIYEYIIYTQIFLDCRMIFLDCQMIIMQLYFLEFLRVTVSNNYLVCKCNFASKGTLPHTKQAYDSVSSRCFHIQRWCRCRIGLAPMVKAVVVGDAWVHTCAKKATNWWHLTETYRDLPLIQHHKDHKVHGISSIDTLNFHRITERYKEVLGSSSAGQKVAEPVVEDRPQDLEQKESDEKTKKQGWWCCNIIFWGANWANDL